MNACISIDFAAFDTMALLARMKSSFYDTSPEDVTWESEGKKLLSALETI